MLKKIETRSISIACLIYKLYNIRFINSYKSLSFTLVKLWKNNISMIRIYSDNLNSHDANKEIKKKVHVDI